MNENKDSQRGKESDDLSMSESAKEIVEKDAIVECRWIVMSLDDKKCRIKQYNQNIPQIEFFYALNEAELEEVMSTATLHTGVNYSEDGMYEKTTFYFFSERKYANKYKESVSKIASLSDDDIFVIEIDLRRDGGGFFTIMPDERDRYEVETVYNGKRVSVIVSPSDGKMRTLSVAVGGRCDVWVIEDNEYMGSTIEEEILLLSEGKIGKRIEEGE